MRRLLLTLLLVSALPLLPAAAQTPPPPVWSSPLALGPSDVTSIAARPGLVVAAGRAGQVDRRGPDGRVVPVDVPGPRRSGLFVSADEGRTWALGTVAGTDGDVIDVTPDVVTVSDDAAFAVFGDAVWRSSDEGRKWRQVGTLPAPGTALTRLPDGRLAAGLAGGGLAVSGDGGETWKTTGTGLPAARVHDVLGVSDAVVLVATHAGAYRSTDAAQSFSQITLGLLSASAPALALAGTAESFRGLHLAMPAPLTGTLIYSSFDQGATWRLRGPVYSQNLLPRVSPGAMAVAQVGAAPQLFVGTSIGLFRADSPQAGAPLTWSRFDPEPGATVVGDLAYADSDSGPLVRESVFAAVRRASPYVVGQTSRFATPGWYDAPEGGRICGGLVQHIRGDLVAACGRHVLRSSDGGATWRPSGAGLPYVSVGISDTPYNPLAQSPDGTLWTSGYHYGLYKSDPAGERWSKVAMPAVSTDLIAPHPASAGTVFAVGLTQGTTHVLWRSTDAGLSWKPVFWQDEALYAVSVEPHSPHRVLVVSRSNGTWVSEDGGETFTPASGLPTGNVSTWRGAYSPAAPGRAWAVTADPSADEWTLYRSDDGGKTWAPRGRLGLVVVNEETEEETFLDAVPDDLAPSPWDPDTVYLTTHLGVLVSRDDGETFTELNSGLVSRYADELAFDRTQHGGMWVVNGHSSSGELGPSMWVYRGLDPDA